jgi:Arc/MetJ family transcription regulator
MERCMRTNIVLDDGLVKEAMAYSSARSKRGLVQEALTTYVAVKRDQRKRASYQDRLAEIRRRIGDRRMSIPIEDLVRNDRRRDS